MYASVLLKRIRSGLVRRVINLFLEYRLYAYDCSVQGQLHNSDLAISRESVDIDQSPDVYSALMRTRSRPCRATKPDNPAHSNY